MFEIPGMKGISQTMTAVSVLDASIQVRLNPPMLKKAGAIIQKMQEAEYRCHTQLLPCHLLTLHITAASLMCTLQRRGDRPHCASGVLRPVRSGHAAGLAAGDGAGARVRAHAGEKVLLDKGIIGQRCYKSITIDRTSGFRTKMGELIILNWMVMRYARYGE